MCDCHFLGKNSYFVKSFLFFMISFLFIPIFFFRDSFPFVLGREQFHSFFLTRKSVCVLKEIRNKKLTFFYSSAEFSFFFSILQICSGRKRVDFFFVVDDYKLVQNIQTRVTFSGKMWQSPFFKSFFFQFLSAG